MRHLVFDKGFDWQKDKDGKLTGKMTSWHKNGKRQSVSDMKDGKFHGKVIGFNEKGQKQMEVKMNNGVCVYVYFPKDAPCPM